MQIIENIALISINETLLFQLVSFLLFMVILNRIMIRPIRKTISEREGYFERVGYEIEAAENKYEDISRQIKKDEAEARKAAFKIREELEAEGQAAANDLIASTRGEITGLRNKVQKDIDAKLSEARKDLDAQADLLADKMISVLLDRRSGA